MSFAAIALTVSIIAAVINTGCLVFNVRRYHALTGHWLPW